MATHRGLGDRLRAGDPYDGRGLSDHDATRIRARMREAARQPVRRMAWQPAAAAAITLVVAFGIWMARPEPAPQTAPMPAQVAPVPARHAAPPLPAPALPTVIVAEVAAPVIATAAADPVRPERRRDLRLTAPGGTRIIWTLDPNFEPVRTAAPTPASEPIERQGVN